MADLKQYLYKVYDSSDNYIMTWPQNEVASEFSMGEELNGIGGQLVVTLARSADDFGEGNDITFNNKVKVYVFDGDSLNGALVFSGFISDYLPVHGADEHIEVTILGYGFELDDYIIGTDLTDDQSQAAGAAEQTFNSTNLVAQSFIPNVSALNAVTVKLKVTEPQNITLAIHENNGGEPAGSSISGTSVTKQITNTAAAEIQFEFESQASLIIGNTYWIVLTGPSATTERIYGDSDDYFIHSYAGTFLAARAGSGTKELGDGSPLQAFRLRTGAASGAGDSHVYQGFMRFNTSSIPDDATITDVTLITRLDLTSSPVADITTKVFARPWISPLDTSQFVPGATLAGETWIARAITGQSSPPVNVNIDWENNSTELINAINKSGNTDFVMATDEVLGTSEPAADYSTYHKSGNNSGDFRPRLEITYADEAIALYSAANPYANGQMATYNGSSWTLIPGSDLYFITHSTTGATTVAYSSQDPGTILRDIMDKYIAQGGKLTYTTSTIELTGTTVSYTFNTNTTLEGLKKCLELAPAGWCFRIDQANNVVHFHEKANAIERSFTLDKDIIDLRPRKTIENMVNTVYFTGAGDPPLFRKYQRSVSVGLYGRKLLRYIDRRVSLAATATTIAEALLDEHESPEIQFEFKLVDNNVAGNNGYDIDVVVLGEIVGLRNLQGGGSSLWDNAYWDQDYWDFNIKDIATALVQIVRLEHSPASLRVFCSTIPPDVNKRIEDINRNLEASLTANNPSQPDA